MTRMLERRSSAGVHAPARQCLSTLIRRLRGVREDIDISALRDRKPHDQTAGKRWCKPGPGRKGVLLVGSDAHARDNTRFLLSLAEVLAQEQPLPIHVLLKRGGVLLPWFQQAANTTLLDSTAAARQFRWLRRSGYRSAVFGSCATGDLLEPAREAGISCIVLAHERSSMIYEEALQSHISEIAHLARHVVFPSRLVREEFLSREPYIRGSSSVRTPASEPAGDLDEQHRQLLRVRLGLASRDVLIVGTGQGSNRRGFDRFLLAAQRLCPQQARLHFCWIGRPTRDVNRWMRLQRLNHLKGQLHLFDDAADLSPWLSAADALYLPSRIDSCPPTVHQALARGKPVILHAGATGFDHDILAQTRQVEAENETALVDAAILRVLNEFNPGTRPSAAASAVRQSTLQDYARQLMLLMQKEHGASQSADSAAIDTNSDALSIAKG